MTTLVKNYGTGGKTFSVTPSAPAPRPAYCCGLNSAHRMFLQRQQPRRNVINLDNLLPSFRSLALTYRWAPSRYPPLLQRDPIDKRHLRNTAEADRHLPQIDGERGLC